MRKRKRASRRVRIDLECPLWKFDLMPEIVSFLGPMPAVRARSMCTAMREIVSRSVVLSVFASSAGMDPRAMGVFRYSVIRVASQDDLTCLAKHARLQNRVSRLYIDRPMTLLGLKALCFLARSIPAETMTISLEPTGIDEVVRAVERSRWNGRTKIVRIKNVIATLGGCECAARSLGRCTGMSVELDAIAPRVAGRAPSALPLSIRVSLYPVL